MNKSVLLPALFTVCSVISVIIFRSPVTYFNLFLSVVILGIFLFSKNKSGRSRIVISTLWLLILELIAFVLLLFDVDFYRSELVWSAYVVFIIVEMFVTPRIDKEK